VRIAAVERKGRSDTVGLYDVAASESSLHGSSHSVLHVPDIPDLIM